MKIRKLILLTALLSGPVFAHEHPSPASAHVMSDAQAIEHNMKKLFDKPDAPLAVLGTTIDGDYAVAGWIQSRKGGRALLKKEHDAWRIQVCGGDGLKQSSTLTQAGLSKNAAERLAQKVKVSESKLTADQLKKLSMFEGMVNVQSSGHDGHAPHPKH